jgi:hypothetical protein
MVAFYVFAACHDVSIHSIMMHTHFGQKQEPKDSFRIRGASISLTESNEITINANGRQLSLRASDKADTQRYD